MIFILLMLFFLVRIIGSNVMPFLGVNKKSHQNNYAQDSHRKEGEVRIEYTDKNREKQKKADSGEGDYIDFEELDKS